MGEALGVGEVRGIQRRLSDDAYLLYATEEDVGRREQGEVGVVVGVIVLGRSATSDRQFWRSCAVLSAAVDGDVEPAREAQGLRRSVT